MSADSALVQRTLSLAAELGLDSTVSRKTRYDVEIVTVAVRRQHVEPKTMLDVARNADAVTVVAVRSGSGRWTHRAFHHGYSGMTECSKLKVVPFAVRMLAE